MSGIVISYRRDDSKAYAGWLYETLVARFGDSRVFRDVDALEPGEKFAEATLERIRESDALIVVIGKQWVSVQNGGVRRLDAPLDFVRAEIREVLVLDKLVVPVLVDGATMPSRAELPSEIAELASRNALELSERHFARDVKQLVTVLESVVRASIQARRADPHILVVEDDAATRDLLEQYLADYKFRVTAAATAAEAERPGGGGRRPGRTGPEPARRGRAGAGSQAARYLQHPHRDPDGASRRGGPRPRSRDWVRTTMSPSRSARASCWRACARCCGAQGTPGQGEAPDSATSVTGGSGVAM